MALASIIKSRRGSASIEFVWCIIVLMPITLFIFVHFQSIMHSSGGLVKSRLKAFTALDRNIGEVKSVIYKDDGTGYGSTIGCPNVCPNCTDNCDQNMNFRFTTPNYITYNYGWGSFSRQIDHSFVVRLE
jgi:hypothetical protein